MAADRSPNCTFCGDYLFDSPRQAACGDRLCGQCYSGYQTRAEGELRCPACGSSIDINTCFRDKAAEKDLAFAILQCTNKGCPWQGEGKSFKSHVQRCKFAVVQCPNPGCGERMYRSDLNMHLQNCQLTPVPCQWCRKDVPLQHQESHRCREEQSSPVPPLDQSELLVTIVCLRATYLCTKQLQLISTHCTWDKAEERLRAENVPVEEVGPKTPESMA